MRMKYLYPGTFEDYIQDIIKSFSGHSIHTISTLAKKIIEYSSNILGDQISKAALSIQLNSYPIISSADHHALLNYKLLYNSNLLFTYLVRRLNLPYTIVPATGSIPLLNNTYPRGFYFKGMKFNFFSERKSKVPLFLFTDKLTFEREKGLSSLIQNLDQSTLTIEEKKFLEFLFFQALDVEYAIENYQDFSQQVSFLNFKLWKYYFEKSIRPNIADMIYIQVNPLIKELLMEYIADSDSLVSQIIFNPAIREIYLENFSGIQGAWDNEKGSHFFWGISSKKRFVRLQVDSANNVLVSKDREIVVKLEKDSLIQAIEANTVLPTLFLDYLVLTFLERFVTLGGFNQLEYLPQMQHAHVKCLEKINKKDLAAQFSAQITDGLICGLFPFKFEGGIDLIWHHNSSNGKFNGNLDNGLSEQDLESVGQKRIQEMLLSAIETMMDSLGTDI